MFIGLAIHKDLFWDFWLTQLYSSSKAIPDMYTQLHSENRIYLKSFAIIWCC